MPATVADKPISIRFEQGKNPTINDMIAILDFQNFPVIIRPSGGSGMDPADIGETVLPFRRYEGTLGNLVKKISRSLDMAVWWENDALYLSDRDRYIVSVPQQQDVVDTVVGELEDFGAEDISPSLYGGRIVYSSRPQINNEVIVPYLNGLAGNLAEITLQLAVVQLQITDDRSRGIDWSSFQMQFGDPARAATGTALTGQTGALSTLSQSAITTGVVGAIKSTGVGVTGAIQYLSQFGRTSTKQMVELRTLAGQPVQLVSSQTTPYVSGLSSTASTNTNSNNVTSSVETESIDTGLTMSFTPFYDSMMGLVVVDVNIDVSSFLGFEELTYATTGTGTSATPQTIKQPKTQSNKLTDIVRVPAGEVVILGGVKEVTTKENRTAPFELYDSIGSKTDDNTTTLNFFILRPVVTIFDPVGANVGATLPGKPIDSSDTEMRDEGAPPPAQPEDEAEGTGTTTDGNNQRTMPAKGLEGALQNGFAGPTGLETQGGP
jgi:hypothetical protein